MSWFSDLFRRKDKVEVIVTEPSRGDMVTVHRDSMHNPVSNPNGMLLKSQAATPVKPMSFTIQQLDWVYEQIGYARRICDQMPNDGTRKGWTIQHPKSKEIQVIDKRLDTCARLAECARLGNRYGGAYVLMVFDEEPNHNGEINTKLPPAKVNDIINLVIFDPDECKPLEWEGNPRSPFYREGKIYQITPKVSGTDHSITNMEVHRSRLLYFGGVKLSSRGRYEHNGIDRSWIEACWDGIRYMDNADESLSEFLHENKTNVLKKKGWDAIVTGDDADAAEMIVEEAMVRKAATNTVVIDAEDDYGSQANPASGLADVHDRLKERMSADRGMPLTLLFGQAPAGLNTDGDSQASNWREQVGSWQTDELLPQLMIYYTYVCESLDADVDALEVEFNPQDEPTEQEAAEVHKLRAEGDKIYLDAKVLSPEDVKAARFGDKPTALKASAEPKEQTTAGPLQDTALNGAQISSMVAVVTAVNAGEISRSAGAAILARAFLMSVDDAEELLGDEVKPKQTNQAKEGDTSKMTA